MRDPVTVPGLVLRIWAGPPERPWDLAALHAHPMNWAAAVASGPRWDSGHSPELGPLASLVITAPIGRDRAPAGWQAEYREIRPVDATRASAMLRTLGHLRRRLEQANARHGLPAGPAEYLARAAAALGVADSRPFAVYHPPRPAGGNAPGWYRHDTATLPAWLEEQLTVRQDIHIQHLLLTEDYHRSLEMD